MMNARILFLVLFSFISLSCSDETSASVLDITSIPATADSSAFSKNTKALIAIMQLGNQISSVDIERVAGFIKKCPVFTDTRGKNQDDLSCIERLIDASMVLSIKYPEQLITLSSMKLSLIERVRPEQSLMASAAMVKNLEDAMFPISVARLRLLVHAGNKCHADGKSDLATTYFRQAYFFNVILSPNQDSLVREYHELHTQAGVSLILLYANDLDQLKKIKLHPFESERVIDCYRNTLIQCYQSMGIPVDEPFIKEKLNQGK